VPERSFTFKIKMPADNFIIRHWQLELQVFNQNLSLLKEQITPEPVHDMRVAIKKLRSYLKLYLILGGKKMIEEEFSKTRTLFSIFGKHRNIEMTRALLIPALHPDAVVRTPLLLYLQLLQDQIAPFCTQAAREYDPDQLNVLTDQLRQDLENLNIENPAAAVRDVIDSSIRNIRNDLKHFKKKSHLVRKGLKDIFYWSKMFDEDVLFTKQELKSLNKILDYLGSIQDHEVMITNLRSFRKTILANKIDESVFIKKLETKAEKKKDRFLDQAGKKTEELLSSYKKQKRPKSLGAPGPD
jgi:CHAD domain-containing protein